MSSLFVAVKITAAQNRPIMFWITVARNKIRAIIEVARFFDSAISDLSFSTPTFSVTYEIKTKLFNK